MKKLEKDEYKCDSCGKIYKKGRSDEEANKEAKELWGVDNASEKLEDDMAIICDDCFRRRSLEEIKEMSEEYKTKIPRNLGKGMEEYYKQWKIKI